MNGKPLGPDKAAKRLSEELDRCRPGMLGLADRDERHLNPMIGLPDKSGRAIWFFARRDTGVAQGVADGGEAATFCVMAPRRGFFACIEGELTVEKNRKRADAHWNTKLDSWLPAGKTDPDLIPLRLDVADAKVWFKHRPPVTVAFGGKTAKPAKPTKPVKSRAAQLGPDVSLQ